MWYFLSSVRPRRALRRQERISDREDVRLPSRSFLQLLPAEVLMSQSDYTARVYFIISILNIYKTVDDVK